MASGGRATRRLIRRLTSNAKRTRARAANSRRQLHSDASRSSFARRVGQLKLSGGQGTVIPPECTNDENGTRTPITLLLIKDGVVNSSGKNGANRYTIMLKYDPKCHEVKSMQSRCDNIGDVSTIVGQMVAAEEQ